MTHTRQWIDDTQTRSFSLFLLFRFSFQFNLSFGPLQKRKKRYLRATVVRLIYRMYGCNWVTIERRKESRVREWPRFLIAPVPSCGSCSSRRFRSHPCIFTKVNSRLYKSFRRQRWRTVAYVYLCHLSQLLRVLVAVDVMFFAPKFVVQYYFSIAVGALVQAQDVTFLCSSHLPQK